jgi:HSP20 family molecular chaperone IbpA
MTVPNEVNPSETTSEESLSLSRLSPSADLFQDDEKFTWLVDLPGVAPEELDLELVNGNLAIEAKNSELARHYGRKLKIPRGGDLAEIDATLEQGLLRIEVRKRAELRPRKIALA